MSSIIVAPNKIIPIGENTNKNFPFGIFFSFFTSAGDGSGGDFGVEVQIPLGFNFSVEQISVLLVTAIQSTLYINGSFTSGGILWWNSLVELTAAGLSAVKYAKNIPVPPIIVNSQAINGNEIQPSIRIAGTNAVTETLQGTVWGYLWERSSVIPVRPGVIAVY